LYRKKYKLNLLLHNYLPKAFQIYMDAFLHFLESSLLKS
jgi:hypothetical protein